jgi:L-threonylcarbamoyladenylate synthase
MGGLMRLCSVPDLAERLRQGEAALLPTDTLPALACRPNHAALLWQLKLRPADKPLILMGADLTQLRDALACAWQDPWLALAERGWPGPLTLVLPVEGAITAALHPGGASLGLRVPACEQARALLRLSGPLATTSINRSGEPAARTAAEAHGLFPELPVLAPVPWPMGSGRASTVLTWEGAVGRWRQLRAGAHPIALAEGWG